MRRALGEIDANTMKTKIELNIIRIQNIFRRLNYPNSHALLLRQDILRHGTPSIFTEEDVVFRIARAQREQR